MRGKTKKRTDSDRKWQFSFVRTVTQYGMSRDSGKLDSHPVSYVVFLMVDHETCVTVEAEQQLHHC